MIDFLQALHWGAIFQIILIDILLGGDNAVVIALACRNLEPRQRIRGIVWGTVGAIVLRVVLIAFALSLLDLPFLKLVGGALLIWIGLKLLVPETEGHGNVSGGTTLWAAVKTIIVADFVMSLDNVIAIAAAAKNAHLDHQLYYVIFGLLLSVPIIVWGSTLVLRLIDRFPVVVTLGAALLGWIAGGMIVNDPVITQWIGGASDGAWLKAVAPDEPRQVLTPLKLMAELAGALVVVAAGKWMARKTVVIKE